MIETTFFSNIFLPLVLALIMLGMGLTLTRNDFYRIFRYPKAVFTGLICQMACLPALAFVIAQLSGLPPTMKTGLVLIAACPGGATSNLITFLLKGNVALSVSMTSLNSLLTFFSIPFIMQLAYKGFMHESAQISLPFSEIMLQVFLITLLPCIIGMYIRDRNPQFAANLERPLKAILPTLLALAMLAVILVQKQPEGQLSFTFGDLFKALPWALLLNIVSMSLGLLVAILAKLSRTSQLTISIEVGLQNSALAISIATSTLLLNNPAIAVPASVYALFSFFTAILFGLLIKRQRLNLRRLFGSGKRRNK